MNAEREKCGKINSIQTLGTLDGPGVRFVVFVQGCNLRCHCCHNPDTWNVQNGTTYTAGEIADKVLNYREYFGEKGGLTVSGGEPLLQAEFVTALFKIMKENKINTCLDTSGCILNQNVKSLLEYTDYVLLDIKYTDNEKYEKYVGCTIDKPLNFLKYLNDKDIPVCIRQVIIPGINNDYGNIKTLAQIINKNQCIKKTELLAFKKICEVKYKNMRIDFPFKNIPETTNDEILQLTKLLKQYK